jgi:hypothetical protein
VLKSVVYYGNTNVNLKVMPDRPSQFFVIVWLARVIFLGDWTSIFVQMCRLVSLQPQFICKGAHILSYYVSFCRGFGM